MPEVAVSGIMAYRPSNTSVRSGGQSLMQGKLLAGYSAKLAQTHTQMPAPARDTLHSTDVPAKTSSTLSLSEAEQPGQSGKSLDETLFDANATAKILTSHISMYLREGWRDKLFYQLDNLLDPEKWDPQDRPLQKKSFETFLKAICDIKPTVRPGLGLSYSGNLIAAWIAPERNRLSLEFAQDGNVLLIGTRYIDEEPVFFSARAGVVNLKKALVEFNCARWLGCD